MRIGFYRIVAIFMLFVSNSFASHEPMIEKPNLVFILVDDLGYADLGVYGSRFHETPRIDRLTREGMRFTDAYAASPLQEYRSHRDE